MLLPTSIKFIFDQETTLLCVLCRSLVSVRRNDRELDIIEDTSPAYRSSIPRVFHICICEVSYEYHVAINRKGNSANSSRLPVIWVRTDAHFVAENFWSYPSSAFRLPPSATVFAPHLDCEAKRSPLRCCGVAAGHRHIAASVPESAHLAAHLEACSLRFCWQTLGTAGQDVQRLPQSRQRDCLRICAGMVFLASCLGRRFFRRSVEVRHKRCTSVARFSWLFANVGD